MLQNICHSNIVPIYELLHDGANYYFVMELVRSGNLHSYLVTEGGKNSRLNEVSVRSIARQLL